MDKPIKPTNLMPRSFGGVKNNWTASMQSSGYEDGVPAIYGGDNLNYQLDTTGKELDYCEKICDYINSIGIGKVLQVNSKNQLDVTQVGVKVYNATESFFLNDIVVAIVSNEVKLYRSLIGNNVGNALTDTTKWEEVSLGSAIDGDGVTINLDSNDILHAIGVLDRKDNSTAIKTWTGARAEYDAIVTKDANTIYNITDDTDVTLSLLELLYPVGAIYIGTMSTCPLAVLGVGTWQLKATDRVLQGSGTNNAGVTVEAGLPNITGNINGVCDSTGTNGAFLLGADAGSFSDGAYRQEKVSFDASRSSSIYGNSTTVQPPAYIVNIWERIS